MPPQWLQKLEETAQRIAELERQMSAGANNGVAWQTLTAEHGRLLPLAEAYRSWQAAAAEMENLRALAEDPEVGALAEDEMRAVAKKQSAAFAVIRKHLSPDAAENRRNCFLEIRAAVGGNESCLFAADLLRMYQRVADNENWRTECISHSAGEVGGYKEIILRVVGDGAFGRLKFESGAHRVQRVPKTESQGRVHTSIVTVAVLAESAAEDNLVLSPADLRVETFRASGAGGQHVNTTDSAVRITHLPSGAVAECQDDRSQHKNREKALAVLRARIMDKRRRERLEKETEERRTLVGSGDRSDRIRTYNFPQGRMTDHRIGLTLYKLAAILEGDIGELLDALAIADGEDIARAS